MLHRYLFKYRYPSLYIYLKALCNLPCLLLFNAEPEGWDRDWLAAMESSNDGQAFSAQLTPPGGPANSYQLPVPSVDSQYSQSYGSEQSNLDSQTYGDHSQTYGDHSQMYGDHSQTNDVDSQSFSGDSQSYGGDSQTYGGDPYQDSQMYGDERPANTGDSPLFGGAQLELDSQTFGGYPLSDDSQSLDSQTFGGYPSSFGSAPVSNFDIFYFDDSH